jgi:hypothetical protein
VAPRVSAPPITLDANVLAGCRGLSNACGGIPFSSIAALAAAITENVMSNPGEQLTGEPQAERGGPGSGEPGSRDTGSDRPSAGTAGRDSGTLDDQRETPDAEDPSIYGGTGELPPQDAKPFLPPYEGRSTTETNPRSGAGESAGFSTAGGASPAGQQSTPQASATESDDGVEAPAHTAGTGRAEDKR